jgi:Eco57I restriction-modification methylase
MGTLTVQQKAAWQILTERINDVYAEDTVKVVWTPFALCKEMIDRVPDLSGNILVLSDLGFIPVLKQYGVDFSKITFVAHTREQADEATQMGVGKIIEIGYNKDCIEQLKKAIVGLKFDIVVGNPPYQGTSEGTTKDTTFTPKIWSKFVQSSFEITSLGGFVSLVTPPGWLIPTSKLYSLIFEENEVLVVIAGIDGGLVFGAATNAAWFLCRVGGDKATSFNFAMHGYDLSIVKNIGAFPTTPGRPITIGILQKTINSDLPKIKLLKQGQKPVESFMEPSDTAKYPNYIDRNKIVWTTSPMPDAILKKAIVWRLLQRRGRCLVPRVEINDTHGLLNYFGGGHTHLLVNAEQTEEGILSYMKSKLVQFICTTFSQTAHAPVHILRMLPAVDMSRVWSDNELYAHFSLSTTEIRHIEDTVK